MNNNPLSYLNNFKNVILIFFILVFFFFFSNEQKLNKFFLKNKSLTLVFILLIIYLIYNQFNIALIVLPVFFIYIINHPNFNNFVNQHKESNPIMQIFHDFFTDNEPPQEPIIENLQINNSQPIHNIQENFQQPQIIQEKIPKENIVQNDDYPTNIHIEHNDINNIRSTSIENLNESTYQNKINFSCHQDNENELNGSDIKKLSFEELEEIYNSVQNELKELGE